MRAYMHARQWPECFYDPLMNEDFGEQPRIALLSGVYDRAVTYFARYGYAVQKGYVDPDILYRCYQRDKRAITVNANARNSEDDFTHLLFWLGLEFELLARSGIAASAAPVL